MEQSKLEQLNTILSSLLIPVAYNHFNKSTQLPYLIFYEDVSNNTFADNTVYYENNDYILELYTENKDITLEKNLKQLLNNNEIPYQKTMETYLDDERMYEIVFAINF